MSNMKPQYPTTILWRGIKELSRVMLVNISGTNFKKKKMKYMKYKSHHMGINHLPRRINWTNAEN